MLSEPGWLGSKWWGIGHCWLSPTTSQWIRRKILETWSSSNPVFALVHLLPLGPPVSLGNCGALFPSFTLLHSTFYSVFCLSLYFQELFTFLSLSFTLFALSLHSAPAHLQSWFCLSFHSALLSSYMSLGKLWPMSLQIDAIENDAIENDAI